MNEFLRSLVAEVTPLWMTHQEPRPGDDTPLPTPGREPVPEDDPEKDLPEPTPTPPTDPEEDKEPIVPVPSLEHVAISKKIDDASLRKAPKKERRVRDKKPPFEPEHVDPPPRDVREAPTPNPNGDRQASNGSHLLG
jgi:hypothetical protein